MTENEKIIKHAKERQIKYLVHFTNIKNVKSIVEVGIWNRISLAQSGRPFLFNDLYRLDNAPHAVSVSVTFPNYRMFYRLRKNEENAKERWVVILLDAKKVLNLQCAFSYTNAANAYVREIPFEDRMNCASFDMMFSEIPPYSRQQRELVINETTDPQAEVLVHNYIPVDCIKKICCEKIDDIEYLSNISSIQIEQNPNYFGYRHDWKFWR